MAISKLNPIAAASSINADSYTVPAAYKEYKIIKNFDAAVYTVTTSPTNSQATITFFGSTSAPQTTTLSGSVTFSLAVAATNASVSVSSGTDTVVTITKTASALTGAELSGTLDTITSSGTYNTTGKLYVMTVGGGGGGTPGSGGQGTSVRGGKGGSKGDIAVKVLFTNNATSVTVGAGGNSGNSGGTTSFGNLLSSAGGAAGAGSSTNPYNDNSGYGITTEAANTSLYTTITAGTNGSGGGGQAVFNANNTWGGPTSGTGSGIGTGGNGGTIISGVAQAGNPGTGYGSGGGGGAGYSNGGYGTGTGNGGAGGAGASGVIYVLRGF